MDIRYGLQFAQAFEYLAGSLRGDPAEFGAIDEFLAQAIPGERELDRTFRRKHALDQFGAVFQGDMHLDEPASRRAAAQALRIFRPAPFLFGRSEEHTSELQSLMRISYAVFCLKKKI